jgi:hypothetical protein
MMASDEVPIPTTEPEAGGEPPKGVPPRIEILVDAGESARYRITIENLNGDPTIQSGETVRVSVPDGSANIAAESARAPVLAPPGVGRLGRFTQETAAQFSARTAGLQALARRIALPAGMVFFGLSVVIYLLTRLVGLADFPIYFFADEAVQTVLAADLFRDNFFDYDKVFLPTYFRNVYQYNLSVSVYLQLLPYLFFGKSVLVTRGVSVLVSLLVPLSVGLALRDIYKVPYWWAGGLVVSLAPAWFLHSRTAFETVLATSLYATFLYLYLLYRHRSPRYLYAVLILAALTFYSYSPAQLYLGVTAILLLISDARYHWQNRQLAVRGGLLLLLLALPYLRFRFQHSLAVDEHLRQLGSFWVSDDLTTQEKLGRYLREYLYGLSPGYWFVPNEQDLSRHVMFGYGHLIRATMPFMVLGLVLTLKEIRQPGYRVLLAAFIAAPAGAALVQIGITRMLVFIVPASLLITLGISQTLVWLERIRLPRRVLATGLFLLLSFGNASMLGDALINGPTWYENYGLHGMQYGARQVFGALKDYLEIAPRTDVVFSHTWANGTDLLARFFLADPLPLEMISIEAYLQEARPIEDETLFVLPEYEYRKAFESGKFTDFRVQQMIYYPNGQPGFYFVQMRYVDQIDEILAAERAARAELLEGTVSLADEPVQVRYSMLDMGEVESVFDGDDFSVARTLEANPFVLEVSFPEPRLLNGFDIIIGAANGELRIYLYSSQDAEPIEVVRPFAGSVENPTATVSFDEAITAQVVQIEVHDHTQGEIGHVHVWELVFR